MKYAYTLAALSLLLAAACPQQQQAPLVWPISGTTTPDAPLSSTFGPRLKASESFRYDFHRGVDVPTPIGSAVHAIAEGTVRIAGEHPGYSDLLVQVVHQHADGTSYYSNVNGDLEV
jgi:murein DD-endopeptidase MepM/ murein hydrolase activator NlpD